MSKTWKWILGILLTLMVIAALVAVGFAWRTHYNAMASFRGQPGWNGPMMGRGDDGFQHPPMWNQRGGWNHPMMDRRGFSPFGGFFLLGGLVKFAFFVGLLYLAYWLGRRNARIVLDPKPALPVVDVPAREAEPASPSPEAEPQSTPRPRGRKIA